MKSNSRLLACYASDPDQSKGRCYPEDKPRFRSDYQRDRDRIIHSSAFRRLEYKTQVFVNHEGDMFRTRLTHSIEVAQIGRTMSRILDLNEDLTEAIALAHDLGHTPFGHAGQDALNDCMRDFGGFEHNLQSLRVVDELEEKYAEFSGLNLTFETREGVLKHCNLDNARALGDIGLRFLFKKQPSLEAQLANLADEIAYNHHDIDDGLRAELINIDQLMENRLFQIQHDEVKSCYPDIHGRRMVHEITRRMIDVQVTDLILTTQENLAKINPKTVDDVRNAGQAIVSYSEEAKQQNVELKRFLRDKLYRHYRVMRMSFKAGRVIKSLFQEFMEIPSLMPPEQLAQATALELEHGEAGRARIVSDYIAGMTDRYAILEHSRLFDPAALT